MLRLNPEQQIRHASRHLFKSFRMPDAFIRHVSPDAAILVEHALFLLRLYAMSVARFMPFRGSLAFIMITVLLVLFLRTQRIGGFRCDDLQKAITPLQLHPNSPIARPRACSNEHALRLF